MILSLARAAEWMNAEAIGAGQLEVKARGWSVDSRTIGPGQVYFALRGPAHDGHDYVPEALERGAICAVIDREIASPGPYLRVPDTLIALQKLAQTARRKWGGRVVAVTGSAGKTTTKDLIAHFLAVKEPVGKTDGNFNNHVGMPLSILRLSDTCRIAVLEMGMNHAGEICELARIAEPQVGVITNVGYAHVEFFDSIDGIALAKRELIDALPGDGVAILNGDDPRVVRFAETFSGRSLTYGIDNPADIRACELEYRADGAAFTCCGVRFETNLAGKHGVLNVLAGIATAQAFEIEPAALVEAARTVPVGKMRGERFERNGYTILNDAYNANPEAIKSMIDVLAEQPARRRVAVLGEMLELGSQSDRLHRMVGAHAAVKGIDLLLGIQGDAKAMAQEAVYFGMDADAALFYADPVEAGRALRALVEPGDAILFKGSRGVRVERAMETLLEATA